MNFQIMNLVMVMDEILGMKGMKYDLFISPSSPIYLCVYPSLMSPVVIAGTTVCICLLPLVSVSSICRVSKSYGLATLSNVDWQIH